MPTTVPRDLHDWVSRAVERDAVQWQARQARAMGWTQERWDDLMERRHSFAQGSTARLVREIQELGHPEFEARPVRVRQYRRRA
jgi:hypothetical protein